MIKNTVSAFTLPIQKHRQHTTFVDRREKLSFNNSESDCWVIKFIQAKQIFTEFWVDDETNEVLMVKGFLVGRRRFKWLIV